MKNTIKDKIIIGAKTLSNLYTWIDVAYAVYNNIRGHTGGEISMGYGIIHRKALNQEINVKRSIEFELVGIGEYFPYNIWFIMFMSAQWYGIENSVIYKDNQSVMCMEKNRRNLCTGNSRHICIRYFFVKDIIDKVEMKAEYCPTHLM